MELLAEWIINTTLDKKNVEKYKNNLLAAIFLCILIIGFSFGCIKELITSNAASLIVNSLCLSFCLVSVLMFRYEKTREHSLNVLVLLLFATFLISYSFSTLEQPLYLRSLYFPLLTYTFNKNKVSSLVSVAYIIILIISQIIYPVLGINNFLTLVLVYLTIMAFCYSINFVNNKFTKIVNKKIEITKNTDRQTGLFNKQGMFDMAEKVQKTNVSYYVLMIDIDNFKSINDMKGHQVGDEYISKMVEILKSCTNDNDFVGRFGGDEFTVLKIIQDYEDIREFLKKLISDASKMDDYPMTISIGCVQGNSKASVQSLYYHADEALYYTKANGKNNYAIYK